MAAAVRRRSFERARRSARRWRSDLWWIAGIGAVSALLAPIAMTWIEPQAPATEPRRAVAASRPAPVPVAPAAPRPVATLPPIRLSPPYEVADGLTIVSETTRVRIAGLDGPPSEAACFDPAGHLWACGLQARAALNNLIRLKDVTCRPTGAEAGAVPLAECSAGGARIDRALVAQGFARPVAGNPAFPAEVAEARNANRGLWNGGWRVRP